MNRSAVTPTFQSACLAGWKTGATNPNRFMVPMHPQKRNEALDFPVCFRGGFFTRDDSTRRGPKSRQGRPKVAHGLNRGFTSQTSPSPGGTKEVFGRNKRLRRRRKTSRRWLELQGRWSRTSPVRRISCGDNRRGGIRPSHPITARWRRRSIRDRRRATARAGQRSIQ